VNPDCGRVRLMNRIVRAAALSLVAVLALSGCLRYNVDITLDSDNKASGTVVTAVQEGIGEQLGAGSDEEALAELFSENSFDTESGDFSSSDYAEDDYIGKMYTFDGLALDQLDAFSELFTVERVGDEYIVSGDSAPTPEGELEQVPAGAESMLTITFPGEVTDHNGTLDGKTVTWDLFTQTEPISATAGATSASSFPMWFPMWIVFVALAILVVLIGVAVVLVIVLRKRKGAEPVAAPGESAPVEMPGEAVAAADAYEPPAEVDSEVDPEQELAAPPAPPAPPTTPAPPAPPTTPAPPAPPTPPAPAAEPEDAADAAEPEDKKE